MAFAFHPLPMMAFLVLTSSFLVSEGFAQPGTEAPVEGENAVPMEPSPLITEPETPEATFRTILLMVDLARLDLAKVYLDAFLAGNPDDELLLALRDQHGTAAFLRLSRITELQPASTNLMNRLTKVAQKQASDSAFVQGLLDQIVGTDPQKRDVAISELRNAGIDAIPQVLARLAKTTVGPERDQLIYAMVRMEASIAPALFAAIESPVEVVRSASVQVLGWQKLADAVPYLWAPAFSEQETPGVRLVAREALARILNGDSLKQDNLSSQVAAADLRERAHLLFTGQEIPPGVEELTGQVELWFWSNELGTVDRLVLSLDSAQRRLAARFAKAALSLSPGSLPTQYLTLATLFATSAEQVPPGSAWPEGSNTVIGVASLTGRIGLTEILNRCLQAGQYRAAEGVLQALSNLTSPGIIKTTRGEQASVLAALNAPDPRVQFAAAIAIARLESAQAYPSASRVIQVLQRGLQDEGTASALIIDADQESAAQLDGYLTALGFRTTMVRTGREGFELAATRSGFDVVVIEANCVRWDLSQTLANFRADSRTAALPIAIYGEDSLRQTLSRRILRHQPATFIAESGSAVDFEGQFRPWFNPLRSTALSDAERSRQKELAAYWLARLGSGPGAKVYDLTPAESALVTAAEDPDIAANVLVALGTIPTATAQSRLATLATNPQADRGVRVAAAGQLTQHLQRHGVLLDSKTLQDLAALSQSEQDPELSSLLSSIQGTVSNPPKDLSGRIQGL